MKNRFGAIGATLALVPAAWGAMPGGGEPGLGIRGSRSGEAIRTGFDLDWDGLVEGSLGPDADLSFLPPRLESLARGRERLPRASRSRQDYDEVGDWALEGFYVGGSFLVQGIEGDFDGDDALFESGGNDVILVPEIDPGLGFALVAGWRTPKVAFEMSFRQTWHDTEFGGVESGDAVLYALDLDVKPYFFTEEPVQPFLLVGMSMPILVLEDALSEDGGVTFDEDATLTGLGFNFGGGFSLFATEQFAVHMTGGYRFAWYFDAEGDEIDDDLDGQGFFASVGVTFTF